MKTFNSITRKGVFGRSKWILVCLSILSIIFLGTSQAFTQEGIAPKKRQQGIVPGQYIVTFHDNIQEPEVVAERLGKAHKFGLLHVYKKALKGFSATMPEAVVERLKMDPDVALVEPDRMVYAVAQTTPTGVKRIQADQNSTALANPVDIDVAIIDTGIDVDHPDLNVVKNIGCNTLRKCRDGRGNDDHGHGSHVAGIVAALDNDIGVLGVAPGARLWAVKVLDSTGSGYLSWVIKGIDWVTANASEIEVANLSLAWEGHSDSARQAIQNSVALGVVYVVAASNESRDVYGADGTFGTADDIEPASYPEVATISAMCDTDGEAGGAGPSGSAGADDSFASFSNFSRTVVAGNPVISPGMAIDLLLPGVAIYSTYKNGGYTTYSGTSMASPHAAGLAALYIAENGRAYDATGVYAIRQALIDGGVEQNGENGLHVLNDPDLNWERLGWAGETGPLTDIAITAAEVDPNSPVVQGDTVTISVTIKNVGKQEVNEEITVSLVDETDGNPIVVEGPDRTPINGLAPGNSEIFTFTCATTEASVGDHDLTASLQFSNDFADDNLANDTKTITVRVTDVAIPTSMNIADLEGSSRWYELWWFFWTWEATVNIFVEDNLGNPVGGATVNIRWSDGSTDFKTTTSNGWCQFKGYQFEWTPSLTLTVQAVSHPDLTYLSGDNHDRDGDTNGTSITVYMPQ